MSSIIEWAEPTPKSRNVPGRKSTYGDALTELRQFPGKFARVTPEPLDGSKAASHASRIRNGLVVDVVPGEFEATDDGGHLFVKYVGEEGVKAWNAAKAERDKAKAEQAAKAAAKAAEAPAEGSNEGGAHEVPETADAPAVDDDEAAALAAADAAIDAGQSPADAPAQPGFDW